MEGADGAEWSGSLPQGSGCWAQEGSRRRGQIHVCTAKTSMPGREVGPGPSWAPGTTGQAFLFGLNGGVIEEVEAKDCMMGFVFGVEAECMRLSGRDGLEEKSRRDGQAAGELCSSLDNR